MQPWNGLLLLVEGEKVKSQGFRLFIFILHLLSFSLTVTMVYSAEKYPFINQSFWRGKRGFCSFKNECKGIFLLSGLELIIIKNSAFFIIDFAFLCYQRILYLQLQIGLENLHQHLLYIYIHACLFFKVYVLMLGLLL